ncbi:MAG: hypothetical protein R3E89_08720 [Thiolinea sp.]
MVAGPRSAAATEHFAIPLPLPPQLPGLEVQVDRIESLRPDIPVPLQAGGTARGYREHLVTGEVQVLECTDTGEPIAVLGGQFIYVAAWLDASALQRLLQTACTLENIATLKMPDGLRRRATATETFWFNYSGQQQVLDGQSYPPLSVTRQVHGDPNSP